MIFKEYDIVKTNKRLSAKINVGTVGTILIIHNSNPPAYEVEFMDKDGNSMEVLTVAEVDIEAVH